MRSLRPWWRADRPDPPLHDSPCSPLTSIRPRLMALYKCALIDWLIDHSSTWTLVRLTDVGAQLKTNGDRQWQNPKSLIQNRHREREREREKVGERDCTISDYRWRHWPSYANIRRSSRCNRPCSKSLCDVCWMFPVSTESRRHPWCSMLSTCSQRKEQSRRMYD